MFRPLFKAAALSALVFAAPAMATTVVVSTTGSTADNGAYGNTLTFSGTSGGTTVNVRATGWQVNQSNNTVTSAFVGAYSPGMGVTGLGDNNGSYGYHQVDNAGGYNDFYLLQFDQAVNLSSLYLNSFTLGSSYSKDNDLGFAAVNYGGALWNSALNLAGGTFVPGSLTTVNGTGANGSRATGSSIYSNQWLVSSAFASGNNDGFKLASLTVNTGAVPEPATWAMMLVGFGAAGVSLRRGRPVLAMQAA